MSVESQSYKGYHHRLRVPFVSPATRPIAVPGADPLRLSREEAAVIGAALFQLTEAFNDSKPGNSETAEWTAQGRFEQLNLRDHLF